MVLSVERFPPQLSQVPEEIVLEVRTMLDGRFPLAIVPVSLAAGTDHVVITPELLILKMIHDVFGQYIVIHHASLNTVFKLFDQDDDLNLVLIHISSLFAVLPKLSVTHHCQIAPYSPQFIIICHEEKVFVPQIVWFQLVLT